MEARRLMRQPDLASRSPCSLGRPARSVSATGKLPLKGFTATLPSEAEQGQDTSTARSPNHTARDGPACSSWQFADPSIVPVEQTHGRRFADRPRVGARLGSLTVRASLGAAAMRVSLATACCPKVTANQWPLPCPEGRHEGAGELWPGFGRRCQLSHRGPAEGALWLPSSVALGLAKPASRNE